MWSSPHKPILPEFNAWDLVVCINDSFDDEVREITYALPVKGEVYTVRSTINHGKGVIGLILFEVINPPVLMNNLDGSIIITETTFNTARFEKIGNYFHIVELFIDDSDTQSQFHL